VNAFLVTALTRVMRTAVPVPTVTSGCLLILIFLTPGCLSILMFLTPLAEVCVCYFVLLNRYWGIVTVPGSIHYGIRLGVCVLLCFVSPVLGNRYGAGVNSFRQ